MNAWLWEAFEGLANSDMFTVSDAGPLLAPIKTFRVSRDDKRQLVIETSVPSDARSDSRELPDGQIRFATENVEFSGAPGTGSVAYGVVPCGIRESWNSEGVGEKSQQAQVHRLAAWYKDQSETAYTVDWLENLDRSQPWTGTSIRDHRESVETRTIGFGENELKLTASGDWGGSMSTSALEMKVAGVMLYLCVVNPDDCKGKPMKPGYIIYAGNPDDEFRLKIRNILSFTLGNYLVYLGCTKLDRNCETVSVDAVSVPYIGNVFDIMLYPPAPLGTRFHREVNQLAVSRMVNAIYAAYDTMDFGKLGWAYWHARCAPVHMAAAHYGAAIEGLYRKYVDGHPEKFRTKIVGDKSVWKSLQDALMKSVSESALEPSDKKLIAAKISNLNAMPFRLVADQLFTALGVPLGEAEIGAWDRRNDAAHGEGVGVETLIPTVMDTRLLMLVLHRLVLKIAESNDSYIDWWSPGMPVRKIVEPVPPPDRASI